MQEKERKYGILSEVKQERFLVLEVVKSKKCGNKSAFCPFSARKIYIQCIADPFDPEVSQRSLPYYRFFF